MTPEENLASLGITLPPVATPIANYVPSVRTGNLLFVSGNGPSDDLPNRTGKLGADLTVEQGYEVARDVGIKLIASIQDAVGDLSRVKRIVKLLGMVNSAPDFGDQPAVINGCSDLLVGVFGDAGKHAPLGCRDGCPTGRHRRRDRVDRRSRVAPYRPATLTSSASPPQQDEHRSGHEDGAVGERAPARAAAEENRHTNQPAQQEGGQERGGVPAATPGTGRSGLPASRHRGPSRAGRAARARRK